MAQPKLGLLAELLGAGHPHSRELGARFVEAREEHSAEQLVACAC